MKKIEIRQEIRQESITKWITGLEIAKPYFYLEWDMKKMKPENQAMWYHKIPEDKIIKWKKVIKVGYREVTLCSSYIPEQNDVDEESSIYGSFLQSHLQKAIRRKNKRASVFTADLLLELNPMKLLRRLPIIMIEDSFIHQSFSTLIWLMCSMSIKNDKRKLHEHQKRWLLGVVYTITCFEYKECLEDVEDFENFVFSNKLSKIHKIKVMDIQDIIYSVETRRCYGGMKGDDNMFQSIEHLYLEKCKEIYEETIWKTLFYTEVRPIYTKKTKFKQKEWLFEGYDFHTNPSLLKILEDEFSEYDQEEHKRTIWHCSSGINYRKQLNFHNKKYIVINNDYIPNNIKDHWNIIKRFIQKKAWGFVQGMLENLNIMYPEWIDFTPYVSSIK